MGEHTGEDTGEDNVGQKVDGQFVVPLCRRTGRRFVYVEISEIVRRSFVRVAFRCLPLRDEHQGVEC